MRVATPALSQHLSRELAGVYLVFGQERLLVEEAADSLRFAAREKGFLERIPLDFEQGFDWQSLLDQFQAMSLFSQQRMVELRLPNGKPGDKGNKTIVECLANKPEDILFVVLCGMLDKRQQGTNWVKAIEKTGVLVEAPTVTTDQLPAWITRRFAALDVSCDKDAAEHMAYYVEGNLLAAAQEIRKLALLAEDKHLTLDIVTDSVGDHARYTVYALADACLSGDQKRLLRVLGGLQREGVEPVLILWALARDIRTLYRVGRGLAAGQQQAALFRDNGVWKQRAGLVSAALRRHDGATLNRLMRCLSQTDRGIKGRGAFPGLVGNVWAALENLCLELAGAAPIAISLAARIKSA